MSKRYYEENFKKQIVKIYNQGNHTYRELSEQYGYSSINCKAMGNEI